MSWSWSWSWRVVRSASRSRSCRTAARSARARLASSIRWGRDESASVCPQGRCGFRLPSAEPGARSRGSWPLAGGVATRSCPACCPARPARTASAMARTAAAACACLAALPIRVSRVDSAGQPPDESSAAILSATAPSAASVAAGSTAVRSSSARCWSAVSWPAARRAAACQARRTRCRIRAISWRIPGSAASFARHRITIFACSSLRKASSAASIPAIAPAAAERSGVAAATGSSACRVALNPVVTSSTVPQASRTAPAAACRADSRLLSSSIIVSASASIDATRRVSRAASNPACPASC